VRPVALETPLKVNNEQAVAILKEYLALAESGEIEAVAIVGLRPDGICTFRWSSTERFTSMAGGLAVLQHRLMTEYA
jgi:hypothetical protein